jgi:hypothetical protein
MNAFNIYNRLSNQTRIRIERPSPKKRREEEIKTMKKLILTSCSATVLGLLTLVPMHSGLAQTAVVQTTPGSATVSTTATGTITQIMGDMIYIKTDGSTEPVGFSLTKNTSYVDDQDAQVQIATVKNGRAVVIYYVMDGTNKVATKVLVRNAP